MTSTTPMTDPLHAQLSTQLEAGLPGRDEDTRDPGAMASELCLRVLRLLHAMPGGMTFRELCLYSLASPTDTRAAVFGLKRRGRIHATGAGLGAVWRITPSKHAL